MVYTELSNSKRNLLLQILTSAIGSAVFALFTALLSYALGAGAERPSLFAFLTRDISLPSWLFFSSYSALGGGVFFVLRRRRLLTRSGRARAMSQNLALLRRRQKTSPESSVIRSTRFTSWPFAEPSTERRVFRAELDEAVLREGRQVRRIWNVKNKEDAETLDSSIRKYANHENVSIRAYFGLPSHLLPEILVVGDKGASISFAQLRSPSALEACLVSSDRDVVRTLQEYFDTLWEQAEHVVESGKGVNEAVKRVRGMAYGVTR